MSATKATESERWLLVSTTLRDYISEFVPTNSEMFVNDLKRCVNDLIDDIVEEVSA